MRVVVVLRGPLPECAETTRFALRGRRGANEFRFRGSVRNRRLAEGTYLVGLRPDRGARRWVAVRVGEEGAVRLPRDVVARSLSRCDERSRSSASVATFGAPPDGGPPARADRPDAGPGAGTPTAPPTPLAPVEPPLADVLGFAADSGTIVLPKAFAIAVLVLLLASVAGITFFLVKFLRPPPP
jgi:hypothetical protein